MLNKQYLEKQIVIIKEKKYQYKCKNLFEENCFRIN